MISKLERVNQFKRELRSYDYYSKCIKECDLELDRLGVQIMGISSPRLDVMGGKPSTYSDTHKLELIMFEEEIIKKRNWYIRLQAEITNKLSQLEEAEKKLLIDLYVNRKSMCKVATELYMSEASVKRKANAIIRKIV